MGSKSKLSEVPSTRRPLRGFLAEERIQIKEVARRYAEGRGCHYSYVSRVLTGQKPSAAALERVRRAVAEILQEREGES